MINAQDFQLHLLEEFEKLRAKQTKSKKGNTSSMVESKLLNSSHTTTQLIKQPSQNKTFLPVDAILYPKI